MTAAPTTIGWREWVGLPEIGVGAVKAKIDTGARTSALHAFDLETFDRDGARWVRFGVHPIQRRDDVETIAQLPIHDVREIKSSNGETETRVVVLTDLKIGATVRPIELTLTNRDEMGFRMLIGREALRGHHLVDPGESFLCPLDDAAIKARKQTPRKQAT